MLWFIFISLVFVSLFVDLYVFHSGGRVIKGKEAYLLSAFWIVLALVFNVFVYFRDGSEAAVQFFLGYLVEKCLSIDNIFIFAVIFSYFNIPPKYQHRVLFYGVLGAFFIRMAFIFVGVYFVTKFSWLFYLFGFFLIYLAFQMLKKRKIYEPEKSILTRLLKKILPVTNEIEDDRFFVTKDKKIYMTPLFLALVLSEATDFIAAIDSVPAILAITTDPFLIYTSNIFALLGLRALYFVVVDVLMKLKYINLGLALVLVFLGIKMIVSTFYPISILESFGIVVLILASSILFSLKKTTP